MLALVVAALEKEVGRPLIQAHAQFLAAPMCGAEFEIRTDMLRSGKSITSAHCTVIADSGEAAYVSASLGQRDDLGTYAWTVKPQVPSASACSPVPFIRKDPGDLHSHLDIRLALDPRDDPKGQACFWVNTPSTPPLSAAFVTLIADYLPEAIHMNTGQRSGATSLDNTIRIVSLEQSEWLLCSIHLDAITSGLFHGHMAIFTEDGKLVALASQSGVVQKLRS